MPRLIKGRLECNDFLGRWIAQQIRQGETPWVSSNRPTQPRCSIKIDVIRLLLLSIGMASVSCADKPFKRSVGLGKDVVGLDARKEAEANRMRNQSQLNIGKFGSKNDYLQIDARK